VNSIDFHRSEDLLVTAGEDDAIRLYNTQTGMEIKHLFSKKHGVCNLCYTHAPQAVVHASNKVCFRVVCTAFILQFDTWGCHALLFWWFMLHLHIHCCLLQGMDHTLRYLSLHDNRYLRYFKGHTQQVTTLCLSPKNDLFMSAAQVTAYMLLPVCLGYHLHPHSLASNKHIDLH